MPQIAQNELLTRIQKGKPVPALLLLGDEPYLRDLCRAQLIGHYVPETARAWAVSRYNAARGEIQAALDQAQTMPMLTPRQVVFLEEAESIESLGETKREEAVKLLDAYFSNPAPFTVLVIEAAALDQRMKLAKLLVEHALVVQVGFGENPDAHLAAAAALAKSLAEEEGVEIEKGAADDLAEAVAADLQRLKTEIRKLATYAAQRKLIRRADVSAMVISEKTATIWELADLLATRQPKKALEFLDRLLREGEGPLPMLGAMAWMYRKLIEAGEVRGVTNGWQAARALGMAPDRAQLAIENARRISRPRLLAGLRALQSADDRLKRSGEDARAVLEFLVTELTAPDARAAGY
jgi:DNA polymerase III subunit delta